MWGPDQTDPENNSRVSTQISHESNILPSGYLTLAVENGPLIDDFPIETSI